MSSWDIQRAYDYPSETDIKLARMRLGIPPYIADYLIAIDSKGKTLMRSPAAFTAWAKKLRKSMQPTTVDEDLPQPLKAERGASQGAVLSPTKWLAFFDILPVALSSPEVKKTTYYSQDSLANLYTHTTQHTWMTILYHRQH